MDYECFSSPLQLLHFQVLEKSEMSAWYPHVCACASSSTIFSMQFVEIHKLSSQIVTWRNIYTIAMCTLVASKSVMVICRSAWQLWTLALSDWWDNLLNSLNSSSVPLAILMWLLPAQATQVHVQGTLCACEYQNPRTYLFVLHC